MDEGGLFQKGLKCGPPIERPIARVQGVGDIHVTDTNLKFMKYNIYFIE